MGENNDVFFDEWDNVRNLVAVKMVFHENEKQMKL